MTWTFFPQVWKRETGSDLDPIPQDLGKFEKAGDEYSIGLALQQIARTCGLATPCLPVRGAFHPRGTQAGGNGVGSHLWQFGWPLEILNA